MGGGAADGTGSEILGLAPKWLYEGALGGAEAVLLAGELRVNGVEMRALGDAVAVLLAWGLRANEDGLGRPEVGSEDESASSRLSSIGCRLGGNSP